MAQDFKLLVVKKTARFTGTLHDACQVAHTLIHDIWPDHEIKIQDDKGKIVADVSADLAVYDLDVDDKSR
jgi:hypothetical protein